MEYFHTQKPIEILWQDEDLLFANKPPGLPTQGTMDPKRPHFHGLLEAQLKMPLVLVHRLDRDTSGVVLFLKTKRFNKEISHIFQNHLLTKTYVCLCKPNPLPADSWTITNHLAPVREGSKSLQKMSIVKKGGLLAETHFIVKAKSKEALYIQAQPKTGRTHQIRIHIASQKTPILGDNLYDGKSSQVPRMMLHAQTLELNHPATNTTLKIESPLPQDFKTLLQKWKLT